MALLWLVLETNVLLLLTKERRPTSVLVRSLPGQLVSNSSPIGRIPLSSLRQKVCAVGADGIKVLSPARDMLPLPLVSQQYTR